MLHREAVPPHPLGLLISLASHPALVSFALVGGTSLALRFGHRISVDLDFFCLDSFDSAELFATLSKDFSSHPDRMGTNSMACMIEGVKVDFVTYRYPLTNPAETIEGLRMWSLPDVIAMKLSAVANRGAKKDFYDAAMLIKKFSLPKLMEHYLQKFPSHDPRILMRSLNYFGDAESDPDPISLTGATWSKVKSTVTAAVKDMD